MGAPYQSQSVSGYNSSPPPDDGTTVAANKVTWSTIKTKLTDCFNTFCSAINSALRSALNVTPSTTSVSYTTQTSDHLTTIEVSSGATISLGDAATMVAQSMGYTVNIYNKSTSSSSTVNLITAANTLCGNANGAVTIPPGASMAFTVNQAGNGYEILGAVGFTTVVLTGAAGTNTITANAPANLIGLFSGLRVLLIPAGANTGAATLNITPSGGSALTAKNIFLASAALTGAELQNGVPVQLVYDGTQFNLLNPPVSAAVGASNPLLGTATASGSASLSFVHTGGTGDVAFDWTKFDEYEFHFVDIRVATSSGVLQAQISEDSGSTYKNGAGTYSTNAFEMFNSTSASKLTTSTAFNLVGDGTSNTIENGTSNTISGVVRVRKPSSSTITKQIRSSLDYKNTGNGAVICEMTGQYTGDANAWTGIKFVSSAGNITSGVIRAYGLKTS